MLNKNIFLIGMMGSGKSSIAPKLSNKFNIPYIDTDEDLLSILDNNFSEISEIKFRQLESVYFLERIKKNHNIYATGGGIILSKENRLAMKNHGIVIFLKTSTEELCKRLSNTNLENRPLLDKNNITKSTNKIWNDRKKYYYDSADIEITTDDLSIDDVVNKIILKLS